MTPQQSFLAQCLSLECQNLCGNPLIAEQNLPAFQGNWTNLEYVAEEHSAAPIAYKQFKGNLSEIPKNTKRAFAALSFRHRKAHEARIKALTEILHLFKRQNIDVVILKGAALAHLVYAKPELRPMRDVDLLVKKSDLIMARDALIELGYTADDEHISVFMGTHHHLPNASKQVDSMKISVEIHHDAITTDVNDSITLENLTEQLQNFNLADDLEANSLNHIDMLRHLSRHGFEPAFEIKLVHMYDLVAYAAKYSEAIDWQRIKLNYPAIIAALQCAHFIIPLPQRLSSEIGTPSRTPSGLLEGMKPLSAIFKKRRDYGRALRELFAPPEWWMYGYYGVNPDNSLFACRLIIHPFNVAKWLIKRARNSLGTRIGTS